MAIVTLCPQCQTGFSVLPEHLSTADGWVSCGKCEHVFQVDQHLFEMDDPQPVYEFTQPLSRPEHAEAMSEKAQYQDIQMASWLLSLLAMALLLQITLFQRHVIGAYVPELQPVLQWLCKPIDCQLSAPMDIELVSMESSTFRRIEKNTFVFDGVIKNSSQGVIMPPALELSLTSDDAVRVRKVISADQLGFHETLRPIGSHVFSLSFTVEPKLSPTIDGYKALLFYP